MGAEAGTGASAGARYRHYRMGAVLGRGGMGEVVSADDDLIGRAVAIKRIRGDAGDLDAVARFTREARIQGQLEHPAIVPVHELGRDDAGAPVLVMKQLRGTTLAEVLRARGSTRQRLLRAFVDVCLAIELAHSRGIVHRDVKPANIMLGDFGEVYVLDWGIARVLAEPDLAPPGTVMGTPGYMAPEQQRGEPVDGRGDVYALGKVLGEIVGDDDVPELTAAIARATAGDPADRYPSARELAEVVERVVDGDRDLAHRRKLAADLLVQARHALGANDRRAAIRSAGRALALDPESAEIAGLVAQLMLEPPAQVPAEVERDIAAEEIATIEAQRNLGVLNLVTVVVFLPLLYWAGVRDLWMYVIGFGLSIVVTTARFFAVIDGRRRAAVVAVVFVGMCASNAFATGYFSPVLSLPISMAVIVRVTVQHSLYSPRLFLAGMLAALAIAAVLVPRIDVVGGSLVIELSATPLDPHAMAAYVTALVGLCHVAVFAVVRKASALERSARRALHVQSWQLRQLVS